MNAGIGAGIANHHLAQQAAQLLRLARLPRPFRVNEPRAELFGSRKLPRLKQGDEIVKFLERVLHRRRG